MQRFSLKDSYKLYEITPQTDAEIQFLQQFHNEDFDFWRESHFVGEATDIMVAPENQYNFENELTNYGLNYKIIVEDVEGILQQQEIENGMKRSLLGHGSVTFRSYMLLNEQYAYLQHLGQAYPDIVTVSSIGRSHEGRDILLIKISSSGSNTYLSKPAILIDAGIHCREWIAPPVALYTIHQLVENSSNAALYQNVDWYIIPNLNPDGYEYTTTVNRLWRKNRRHTVGAPCVGTDLNRNFGYCWMCGGASSNSCSETYAGPEPFSEPESQAVRNWLLSVGLLLDIKLYLSFHSFGEYILYPWSYQQTLTDNADVLHQLGVRAAEAIEANSDIGSHYEVNSSAIGLYIASGVTSDWMKGSHGVNLSYIFELPNGDAPFWFMIPARQILPVVRETFAGIRAMFEYIEETFVYGTALPPENDFIIRRTLD
ncbi:hypothetical protein ABEB36_006995 [Hypothenemus hampei]|uniref:Peptidase M14 domain-containing protein n=1 Tax=Hypothenemus hampei TaxID=57062 RepID=A0ABD1ESG5_HYPHA